jgi:hypothetical protein
MPVTGVGVGFEAKEAQKTGDRRHHGRFLHSILTMGSPIVSDHAPG